MEFVRINAWAATDKEQLTPIGFDIVFPMMINYANELGLTLPLNQDLLDSLFRNRDSEIKRNQNLDYAAEGLGGSLDWDKLLRKQKSNGSLFNSPATTAAALIHCQDHKCFEYLHSVLKSFKTWVPTIYPVDIYTRLCMIDTLHRLGVDRYFQSEINNILQETNTLWQKREEEIFADITCCAMAFRLLRIKGYEVSSDELAPYAEQEHVSLQMSGVTMILELYKASQIRIYEEESTLEKLHAWTSTFLKQELLSKTILDKQLQKQVEYDLKNFHGIIDRLGNRRNIELYGIDHYQILKAAFRCPAIYSEDLFLFSRQDFNICQAQQQKELQQLERWYTSCGLDRLKHGRNSLHTSHFMAATMFGNPEWSDARMSLVKASVLGTHMDDFFDHYGSREESLKIIELVKMWNEQSDTSYGSQEVEILFTALYDTVNEWAARAYIEQGRCVKHLLISLWVDQLSSCLREMDWWNNETNLPNIDEYLSVTWVSTGCRSVILTLIHFLGIKLSEDAIVSEECISMCRHVSLVVRLLNDLRTSKREQKERKIFNSVRLLLAAHDGAITEEEAILKIEKMVEYNRRKLLQLILQTKECVVPRECRDVFWKLCQLAYYLYSQDDEFSSPQQRMELDVKSLIHEPFSLPL